MADDAEVPDNPDGGTGDKGGGDGEPKLIFGKFKSVEDAEKAYREAEKKISHQGQTLSEREARLRDLEEKSNLAAVIKELAGKRGGADDKPDTGDYDKFIAGLAEEAGTDPAGATKRIVALMGTWAADAEGRSTKHADERVSAMEAKMSSLLEQIGIKVEQLDPAYQKDKAVIDSLVKKGMTVKAAREWVAELEGSEDAPLQRVKPPLGAPAGGGNGGAATSTKGWALSAKEKAEWKQGGLTDKDIADYELERKGEWEAEQAERARKEQS